MKPLPGRLRGLPPVLAADSRVLVLGSFPGAASLAAHAYYAHPRNHFWPIMAALLDEALVAMPYPARLAALQSHRVGLWDTIVACRRPGSLDAAIRDPLPATPARVARRAPGLQLVCFNGKMAARAAPEWQAAGYATLALPSTSPAYTLPWADKLAAWCAIADHLEADDPSGTSVPL